MRNMSFMLTEQQFLDGSKDITRRLGWLHAKPGDVYRAIRKGQGLKKGEKIVTLGYIRVVDARRERLDLMIVHGGTLNREYGFEECRREGFPDFGPEEFVGMFCESHKGCKPETEITRIQFVKVENPDGVRE